MNDDKKRKDELLDCYLSLEALSNDFSKFNRSIIPDLAALVKAYKVVEDVVSTFFGYVNFITWLQVDTKSMHYNPYLKKLLLALLFDETDDKICKYFCKEFLD